MKKRHKAYLKLNLISLLFVVVSFISVTLAWFAYSGLASIDTEVNVKAWYIELEKDGKEVSSDIVISLDDIYPGMQTVDELVKIKNKGDSDAQVSYSIVSARLLNSNENNFVISDNLTSEYVEDKLSHDYPFHININLSKKYTLAKDGESIFQVSVSWPLDSADDDLDSYWGKEAYKFQQDEQTQKKVDPNYEVRPSIKIVISVKAEQYIESDNSSDVNYDLGKTILFNPVSNTKCTEIGSNCLETHIIDVNNKLGDKTVTLLPNIVNYSNANVYGNYGSVYNSITSSWTTSNRPLNIADILKIISTDIKNSVLTSTSISNQIIGNLSNTNRITTEINKAILYNGYYNFSSNFNYLNSLDCYWVNSEYNTDKAFAVSSVDENNIKLYGELKSNDCKIIPVIVANKTQL